MSASVDFQGFGFDPAALGEADVDLDAGRRKEILFADAKLATWTHWEVLGVPWNASSDAARAAYVERVKVFHPDRYPGTRLGSYRARLARVFRRLTEARDVLQDEVRRAEYARKTATATEFAKMEARRLDDERRAEERRARLARQNPLLARAGRVAELTARGRAAFDEGRFSAAANDLQLAQGLDPQNRELAALAADARRKAGAARANEAFQRGLEADALGNLSAALECYREALAADPGHVRSAAHAAKAAVRLGDLDGARAFADAALKGGPRVGVAHEALAVVLEAAGSKKEARRALEKAIELDPRLESARERLRRLRWSFLG